MRMRDIGRGTGRGGLYNAGKFTRTNLSTPPRQAGNCTQMRAPGWLVQPGFRLCKGFLMIEQIELTETVGMEQTGLRLDQAAAQLFPDFSRARLQEWIKEGQLTINGEVGKTKDKVLEGDVLLLLAELEAATEFQPETMPLDILHE